MKKLFVLIPMLLFGLILFAQNPIPPDDIIEWASRFPEMVGSFWGVAVSVVFLVPLLIGLLNQTEAKKIIKYLITGFVTVILIVLASVLDFGYLHNAKLWFVILNGASVIGAQIFGYALFHDALDRVAEKFNPWKLSE